MWLLVCFCDEPGREHMKLLVASLVLAGMAVVTPKLHADPVLTVNGGVVGATFVETPIVNGFQWVYTDNTAGLSLDPPFAYSDNNVFTATFTDVAGVKLLNVNDVCANLGVLIPAPSCAVGFTFTDVGVGTPFLISNASLLGVFSFNASVDTLGVTVADVSVGGGSAQFGFGQPPAATPEPGSLGLLGTGVLGVAGVVRRRILAS